jgi:hypothetical protein
MDLLPIAVAAFGLCTTIYGAMASEMASRRMRVAFGICGLIIFAIAVLQI